MARQTVVCVVLLVAAGLVHAGGRLQLVIKTAAAEGDRLNIEGVNFLWANDSAAAVTLSGESLPVESVQTLRRAGHSGHPTGHCPSGGVAESAQDSDSRFGKV
jgi:hypothetical protein